MFATLSDACDRNQRSVIELGDFLRPSAIHEGVELGRRSAIHGGHGGINLVAQLSRILDAATAGKS